MVNKLVILRIVQIGIGLTVFNSCISPVSGEPQVVTAKPTTITYNDMGMPIRTESPHNVKLSR